MRKLLRRAIDSTLQSRIAEVIGGKYWNRLARKRDFSAFLSARHIFVVGCGHSGTSILLARLDNHSNISAIPGESRFFQRDRLQRSILLSRWLKRWSPDVVIAEKTPVHIRYCDQILNQFPNAKIVGVCRHPLDVVASLYLRHDRQIDRGIDRWVRDNRILVTEKNKGNLAYIFRYEEFVADPASTLRELQIACELPIEEGICRGVGERRKWYVRRGGWARLVSNPSAHDAKRQRQVNQDIFDGRGKYGDVLSPEQISTVWARTRRIAEALDYGDSPFTQIDPNITTASPSGPGQ